MTPNQNLHIEIEDDGDENVVSCFVKNAENKSVLTFPSKTSNIEDVVCGFQAHVLNILFGFNKNKFDDSGTYLMKDSYRDEYTINIQKTGNIVTQDDGFQEYEYSYALKMCEYSEPEYDTVFIKGNILHYSEHLSDSILKPILFDIQEQVTKMIVNMVKGNIFTALNRYAANISSSPNP